MSQGLCGGSDCRLRLHDIRDIYILGPEGFCPSMPPREGGSTSGNIVDGDVSRRGHRLIFKRTAPERIHPGNAAFERRVAELQARQQEQQLQMYEEQQQMAAAIVGSMTFSVCYPDQLKNLQGGHVEDGGITWNDYTCGTSTPPLHEESTQQVKERLLEDSAQPPDDTDFLEGTFYKINLDKQKATTRNKKSSKKQKKKKGKGSKSKKQSHASEMQSEAPTDSSSSCASVTSGEILASSSCPVAAHVPLLEYSSSSSSSSRVTVKPIITSGVNNASSGNEKERSASRSSNDDFKSFESTTSYTTATSSSVNDYAGSLSDARSDPSFSASGSTNSRGFKKTSGEGNKPNVHQSFSLATGHDGSQEALHCRDYASNDGDFQKVVSRKSAKKMKKMQRWDSPAPSSTKAASGSGPIITPELVPRAPYRELITIGHYINDGSFYGRKPNQKKGKYQKARSLSNLSKASYTDGDNVSGSNTMLVIKKVDQAKPRSNHHVILEAIDETNSPKCLPKEGELKATALVADGIKDTESKAPSSDKSSALGCLDNSSCVDREQQKKAMALVGADTENTRAPSSDKSSSLGGLDNPPGVDRKEQKKAVALVGGTGHRDSRAPTSDKTSSLGHLVNFSACVDREEQKKDMSPVGGDTKETDSRAETSDKTVSLCHLAISSCAHSEKQKKVENRIAFSTHGSSELDKIIKVANNSYEIQAASDVYMFSGIHADIENFLHAATPVIGHIPNIISLQDQHLGSVWSWYEEPECCGIEVQMRGKKNSIWPEFSTYFRPLLSAVQLFGQSGNSKNHGGLVFEYFESENPYLRPPIFTKIKQLRDGINLSGSSIFGDPKQLEIIKLSDLHPASWFSVAWYPICQIPAAAGSCQASFLTYHSLGKLVPQTCSMVKADGHDRMICPIIGLLGYKDQEEKWFQLREQLRFKPAPNVSSETNLHAELLNKRLRILRQGASIMSKAVVPRASGEAMNSHSDYEFFCKRSR